ncbi:YheC/YheD family protein [Priestia megaterium]|uniref:YheC/YheD family endospore coat-associated protein n=1 Tax=Priestia megaterium TaxID=1404 RepID=UPI001DD176FF|nr:YheC/YheD family protein [Priestia megaterium]CAH0314509.1 Endospore coat-associated protein YheD [Priestia megaterium]
MIIINQNKHENPVIGICVSKLKPVFQRLVEKRLERYTNDITVIKFYIDDLDFKNRKIKGIALKKKEEKIHEIQGVFPLPNVIYLQCHVEPKIVRKIEGLIGRKVFNNFIFDKWEYWEILRKDDALNPYLPYTQKLEHKTMLQHLLYAYKDIFLKPVDHRHGHGSRGVFRVKRKEGLLIEVTYREKESIQRKSFESYEKFQDWISPKLSKTYIIQQSIQTITCYQKATDIRLNMNKNSQGQWEVSLLLLRVASNDSHITQKVLTAQPIKNLTKMFPSNKNIDKVSIEETLVNIGFKICHSLDKSGHHMADLGIDLGIDEHGHVWIFEVNSLPHPLKGVLDHSLTRPIEYSAYLALE